MTPTLALALSLAVSGAPADLPDTASLVAGPIQSLALSSTAGPTTLVLDEIALPSPLLLGVGDIEQQEACSNEGALRTSPTGFCCPLAGHEVFITEECQNGSWVIVWTGCAISSVCGWF